MREREGRGARETGARGGRDRGRREVRGTLGRETEKEEIGLDESIRSG
jgi:hypothetical protein